MSKFEIPADIKANALARVQAKSQAVMTNMFNNERIVDNMAARELSEANLLTLEGIVLSCKQLPGIVIEGREVKVNVFPVNEARFGKELGTLLGLITTASTALEQHQVGMLSYIGISPILAEKIRIALGSQPYFSKRSKLLVDGYVGNAEDLRALVVEASAQMGLNPVDVSAITQPELQLMYTKGKLRAETQQANNEKLTELSGTDALKYEE